MTREEKNKQHQKHPNQSDKTEYLYTMNLLDRYRHSGCLKCKTSNSVFADTICFICSNCAIRTIHTTQDTDQSYYYNLVC